MSPRGYHQREFISPYFTSEKYLASDQHQEELATMDRLEKKAEAILTYPAKIARKVWIAILIRLGYIKDLTK
jgi:hypothetical protein